MVNVKHSSYLFAGLMALSNAAFAQENTVENIVEPVIERQAIDVDLHSADWEIGIFGGAANLDGYSTNAVVGFRGAYHLNENIFVEASYGETNHTPKVTFLNGVLGYNFHQETFVTSGFTAKTSLFFVGGGGYTEYDGGAEFKTIVGGAGYRIMLNDSFSLRLDLRGHLHKQFNDSEEWSLESEANAGVSYFF